MASKYETSEQEAITTYAFRGALGSESLTDLQDRMTSMYEDPLTVAIRPWSTSVLDKSHGYLVSGELWEGTDHTVPAKTINRQAFNGSFGLTVDEGSPVEINNGNVIFRLVEMAAGSLLLKTGETPGVGLSVSAVVNTSTKVPVDSEIDDDGNTLVTFGTREEARWWSVGWIIPERIPHAMTAGEFLNALAGTAADIWKATPTPERTAAEVTEEEHANLTEHLI